MKKKYVVTTVAMLAAVSMLAACGNKETNTNTENPTVTVAPTEAPSSEERGDGPTEVTPEAPEVTVDHNQMIQNMVQALKETYGTLYRPDMQVHNDEYYMKDTLGLDPSWYDAAYAEVPGISFGADKLIIIHPTEGNLENVQNALNTFKEKEIADGHQYPALLPQKQAAFFETLGEYVCYMIFTGSVSEDMMFEEDIEVAVQAYAEASQQAARIVAGVISGEIVVTPWTELDKMRNEIVKWYGTTYYPIVKVHDDEAALGAYLADILKIDAAWVDDVIIEVPMNSVNADILVLVDPSEGNGENVLAALQAYKAYLIEEARQYPMNEARVQTAAVAQVGDYVCFSILGGAVDNPEEWGIMDETQLAEYYEGMNMNAIYALQSYLGIWE